MRVDYYLLYGINIRNFAVFDVHGEVFDAVKVFRQRINESRRPNFAVLQIKFFGRYGYAYKLAEEAF